MVIKSNFVLFGEKSQIGFQQKVNIKCIVTFSTSWQWQQRQQCVYINNLQTIEQVRVNRIR